MIGSAPCLPQFRKPPSRVELVSPYSGRLVPFKGEQIWLAPSQGASSEAGPLSTMVLDSRIVEHPANCP